MSYDFNKPGDKVTNNLSPSEEIETGDQQNESIDEQLMSVQSEQLDKNEQVASDKNKSNGRKVKIAAIIACAAVIVLTVGIVLFYHSYTTVGSISNFRIFSVSETEIDLTGDDLKSLSGVERCKNLQSLKVLNISSEDVKRLEECGNLKRLEISSSDFTVEQVDSLCYFADTVSNCDIVLKMKIGDKAYSNDIHSLEISQVNDKNAYLLKLMRDLTELDISDGNVSFDTYKQLYKALPKCVINYNIAFGDAEYNTIDTYNIKISDASDDTLSKLEYFYNLKKIDATECTDYEKLMEVYEKLDKCNLFWNVEINGFKLNSNETKIDISGKIISDMSELDKFKYFTNLEYVDMCSCGLSNEQMEELGKKYPNVKFVWLLTLGKGAWHIRTDAKVFSTLNQNDGINEYDQEMYSLIFKYCTDLLALDLGHNRITSLEGIQNLKKLRALILTDNKIKDISPLSELTELEFLEINASNRIQSLEPLKNLKKLKILNLFSSDDIKDISPLFDKPNLTYVVFPKSVNKKQAQLDKFKKSNPNCRYTTDAGYYAETGMYVTSPREYTFLTYRINVKRAFGKWWSIRNEDVGENWENAKKDKNFTNAHGEYYYNSRSK